MAFTDDDREKLTEVHTIVVQSLVPRANDHEARIRKVESNQLKAVGALGALTFVINGILAWCRGGA